VEKKVTSPCKRKGKNVNREKGEKRKQNRKFQPNTSIEAEEGKGNYSETHSKGESKRQERNPKKKG